MYRKCIHRLWHHICGFNVFHLSLSRSCLSAFLSSHLRTMFVLVVEEIQIVDHRSLEHAVQLIQGGQLVYRIHIAPSRYAVTVFVRKSSLKLLKNICAASPPRRDSLALFICLWCLKVSLLVQDLLLPRRASLKLLRRPIKCLHINTVYTTRYNCNYTEKYSQDPRFFSKSATSSTLFIQSSVGIWKNRRLKLWTTYISNNNAQTCFLRASSKKRDRFVDLWSRMYLLINSMRLENVALSNASCVGSVISEPTSLTITITSSNQDLGGNFFLFAWRCPAAMHSSNREEADSDSWRAVTVFRSYTVIETFHVANMLFFKWSLTETLSVHL